MVRHRQVCLHVLCHFIISVEPSAPPQTVMGEVISATEISVSWSEVPPIHQNGIITVYEVSYTPLEDLRPTLQNTTDMSTSLTGLHEFSNYSIQVRAYTEVGPGPDSSPEFTMTNTAGRSCMYIMSLCSPVYTTVLIVIILDLHSSQCRSSTS